MEEKEKVVINVIKLNQEELAQLTSKNLKEEPTNGEEIEESDQVADVIEANQYLKCSVLDLVSPLLGEF